MSVLDTFHNLTLFGVTEAVKRTDQITNSKGEGSGGSPLK